MNSAIIIPARYGSTRFPGKPLAQIAGKTMLSRVVDVARSAVDEIGYVRVIVATEDERIFNHAQELEVTAIMTSNNCATGSDRVLEAIDSLKEDVEFVFGLQGDAPFTPAKALVQMAQAVEENPDIKVITPVVPLRWEELDRLRDNKKQTPFSGTTAIVDKNGKALWFSKNIIPAIRKENELRENEFSPVIQHIGLYGYKVDTLREFVSLPQSHYETLEGLEQLRFLENDIPIHTVTIELEEGLIQSGIDSPEDIERAEEIIQRNHL